MVLPVIALIVGTGVLGSEIDDGTLVHILAKPLPRREIILAKLAVAVGVTTVVTRGAAVRRRPDRRVGTARARPGRRRAAGALAYCAVFVALSLLTRRPVLLGLVYVLIWEGLLGNVLSGTRVLSIQQYVITIAAAPRPGPAGRPRLAAGGARDDRGVHGRRHGARDRPAALVHVAGETS